MTADELIVVKTDLSVAIKGNIAAMQKCQAAALSALKSSNFELAHTMMFRVREDAQRSVSSLAHWVGEFKKTEIDNALKTD